MRVLVYLLVGLSVLLSAGGVVHKASADTASDEHGVCEYREPASRPSPPFATRISSQNFAEASKGVVDLNRNGYAYSDPGEYRPLVPSTHTAPPASIQKPQ